MKYGIACYILIRIVTQNYANRGIITFSALQFIIHSHIHIHLSNIIVVYY